MFTRNSGQSRTFSTRAELGSDERERQVGVIAQRLEIGKDPPAGDPRRGCDKRNREIDRGLAGGPHPNFRSPLVTHGEMTRIEPLLGESAARVVRVEVAADESGTGPPPNRSISLASACKKFSNWLTGRFGNA